MSGPKVLRTITREELLELATVQQAIVDHVLKIWKAEISDTDDEAQDRYDRFLAGKPLIATAANSGRPEEIVRCANILVDAINLDIDRMRDDQYVKQAKAKTQTRALQLMSRSLLDRCINLQIEIPTDHVQILQQSAAGKGVDNGTVSKIVACLMDKMAKSEGKERRTELQDLATSLMSEGGGISATGLLERLELETRDARIAIADKQIAELQKLGESSTAEQMERRLSDLLRSDGNIGSNLFSLTLDILGMEIVSQVKTARSLDQLRRDLAAGIAASTATNDMTICKATFDAASLAIEQRNEVLARQCIREGQQILESCRQRRAGNAARNAMLTALGQLGYTVQEGMETSWAKKKRLVIQNQGKPGLALEMTGNSDAGRIQARIVALQGIERGSATDHEVETEWCSNLEALRRSLETTGSRLEIERAVPAGVQPLKVISSERTSDEVAVLLRQQQREMRK